ncbi:conserved hypothetical protein [Burkholderia vietnamiensis]|nr:hypothetical protein MYA_3704 [Burkholderia sp. KJ006]CAG9195826.1 conserved hypothetical protein [Burkholderia vietnamiensis]
MSAAAAGLDGGGPPVRPASCRGARNFESPCVIRNCRYVGIQTVAAARI